MNAVIQALAASLFVAAPAAESPPDPLLAGPAVTTADGTPTLVRRAYTGRLETLDIPPEEAALPLLGLSDEETHAAQTVLAQRAAILDRVVGENIRVLLELFTAHQAGENLRALDLLGQIERELGPLRARGPLLDELAEALPEHAEKLRALVDEYRAAELEEARQRAAAENRRFFPRVARAQLERRQLGRELYRSFQRRLLPAQERFERILEDLQLEPEQETRVRNLATDFAQQTLGNPSPKDRLRVFTAVMAELTPEQRRRALRLFREEDGL